MIIEKPGDFFGVGVAFPGTDTVCPRFLFCGEWVAAPIRQIPYGGTSFDAYLGVGNGVIFGRVIKRDFVGHAFGSCFCDTP